MLPFKCPKCNHHTLVEFRKGITLESRVVDIHIDADGELAVEHGSETYLNMGVVNRYCCEICMTPVSEEEIKKLIE